MDDYENLPDFDSLPQVQGMPKGCAWGVFDQDGKKDTLGCLNLLTPSVIREAYKEARDGVTFSLNHPMDVIKVPTGRAPTTHKILTWKDDISSGHCSHACLDDEVSFNTQASSQWDSLLHYPHQGTGRAYNGVRVGKEQLQGFDHLAYDPEKRIPSIDHWHDRGGVVGRGVLLDYRAYAEVKGVRYEPLSRHTITVEDLEAVAEHQGTEFKRGDILVIRTGLAEDLAPMTAEQQLQKMMDGQGGLIGVEGNEKAAKWFWNHHFAAVAADNLSFEVYPPQKADGTLGDGGDLVLHPYFLSLFGLTIGEIWNLKALSEYCAKTGRYTFLLTSAPLNIPGLVGSPPNALALM
ncbi:hypothetical protein PG993_003925 [Apiospora rasikravindrae]|uniref:Cyclase n=1 Tax=Apiospora rasikravindrae TaxID=990691 RepID=A0ABR1U0W8_9PEZI